MKVGDILKDPGNGQSLILITYYGENKNWN
jgi:hypothetical protein